MTQPTERTVVSAVQDLLFKSKILETADQLGIETKFPRKPEKLLESVRSERPDLIVLDLGSEHFRPLELLTELKSDPELRQIPTIGFLPHVEQELADAARAAGCDRVVPRGSFSKNLPKFISAADSPRDGE